MGRSARKRATDSLGWYRGLRVQRKHGVPGLFLAKTGQAMEGAAGGRRKNRAGRVQEMQRTEVLQNALALGKDRILAPDLGGTAGLAEERTLAAGINHGQIRLYRDFLAWVYGF
jgi:hypothetical protein